MMNPQTLKRDIAAMQCLLNFASIDPTRTALHGAYCVSKRKLVATNGHAIVVVELAEGGPDFTLPDSAVGKRVQLETAVARLKLGVDVELLDNPQPYPEYQRVLRYPAKLSARHRVGGFNPDLIGRALTSIAKLSLSKNYAVVEFHYPADEGSGLRLVTRTADFVCEAMVMQMRFIPAAEAKP